MAVVNPIEALYCNEIEAAISLASRGGGRDTTYLAYSGASVRVAI